MGPSNYVHMDNKDNRKLHINLNIKFIAALFIVSKTICDQNVHQLMNKKKTVCFCRGILFGHKINDVLVHTTIWANSEHIVLSERSQIQKRHLLFDFII